MIRNKLFFNTIIYGISGSLVALIPLILLPFMTRNLSQTEYGSALFFSAMLTMILPFVGFGTMNAISVRFFQLPKKSFNSYLWSCIFILLVSSFIILFLFIIFRPFISSISVIPFKWFLLAGITACLWGVSQACGVLLIAKKMAYKYLLINLVIGSITIIFTLISIKYFEYSWEGFAWGIFLAHLCAALLSFIFMHTENKASPVNKDHIKDSIKFGMPILIHSISMSSISYFDRFIITSNLGLEELAKYGVAFQLALILNFIAQAFNKAFVPFLYSHLKSGTYESKIAIVRATYLIFLIIILATIIFSFALKFLILYVAGKQYIDIYNIAVIISIGGAFNAAYLMVVNYIFYAGKTLMLGLTSFCVACFFILLSVFMVPRFGLEGASISFLAANILLFVSIWILAQRSFDMPWFSRRIFKR